MEENTPNDTKSEQSRITSSIKNIGGYLHRVVPIVDKTGKVINHVISPFQVEFKPRDIFQIIVGAYLLTVPVAFTEEVWVLSEQLSLNRVYAIGGLSFFFIACFVFFNFYRYNLKGHWVHFIMRVLATYFVSLAAVALFLTIIDKCPWKTDHILAIKRIIIVAFPASMAATISDTIK